MESEFQPVDKFRHNQKFEYLSAQLHDMIGDMISFSGICKDYCVCIVDAVNSTRATASLTPAKTCKYYSVFLNAIGLVARGFGASVVKNVGDSILYYFPKTAEISNRSSFSDVMDCGLQMIELRHIINKKMFEHGIPPISFRISADFGPIMKAKSQSSLVDDIFGATVNMCSKINSKTMPNTMTIGSDMYQIVKTLPDYKFKQIAEYRVGFKQSYPIYDVTKHC
ncbi:MAG: adenylate/guanylate cyclase domain-containing protein [Nitrososphaerota archaeon]